MKNLILILVSIFIFSSVTSAQWISIDSVRTQDANGVSLLLGQTVTTRGVVTTKRELGASIVYFQTRTAGLVAFDAPFAAGVKRGDSIEVTGVVIQFNGLTELSPVTSFTILDSGKIVDPITVTCTQVKASGETYEGRLIKILNVTAVRSTAGANVTTWTVSGSGTNYRIFSGGDSCDIRIYASSNVANQPIPSFPFNVVTLTSQFRSSAPFTSGYQIIPRDSADFSIVTKINSFSNIEPQEFILNQNYPNPFNPTTQLEFTCPPARQGISELGFVTLKVYDLLGNEVATLVNENKPAGSYVVNFNGEGLSSGVYFYSLFVGSNRVDTKKMFLLK